MPLRHAWAVRVRAGADASVAQVEDQRAEPRAAVVRYQAAAAARIARLARPVVAGRPAATDMVGRAGPGRLDARGTGPADAGAVAAPAVILAHLAGVEARRAGPVDAQITAAGRMPLTRLTEVEAGLAQPLDAAALAALAVVGARRPLRAAEVAGAVEAGVAAGDVLVVAAIEVRQARIADDPARLTVPLEAAMTAAALAVGPADRRRLTAMVAHSVDASVPLTAFVGVHARVPVIGAPGAGPVDAGAAAAAPGRVAGAAVADAIVAAVGSEVARASAALAVRATIALAGGARALESLAQTTPAVRRRQARIAGVALEAHPVLALPAATLPRAEALRARGRARLAAARAYLTRAAALIAARPLRGPARLARPLSGRLGGGGCRALRVGRRQGRRR